MKYINTNIDAITGEITVTERDFTKEELNEQKINAENAAIRKAEADAKAAARQALLNRLGITQEEAQLLLGGN